MSKLTDKVKSLEISNTQKEKDVRSMESELTASGEQLSDLKKEYATFKRQQLQDSGQQLIALQANYDKVKAQERELDSQIAQHDQTIEQLEFDAKTIKQANQ